MRQLLSLVALGWLAIWPLACVDLTRPVGPTVTVVPPDGGRPDAATERPADAANDGGHPEDGPPSTEVPAEDTLPPADKPAEDTTAEDTTPEDTTPEPPAPPDADPPGPDVPTVPPKASLGIACTTGDSCDSGRCVDGVCCDSDCNSACYTCVPPGQPGHCLPTAAGVDPDNDCAASAPESCGLDGVCSGAGTCRFHPASTPCVTAACNGSTATSGASCTGTGQCATPTVRDCTPYLCGATACRTSCASPADCKPGLVCTSNLCVQPPPDAGPPDVGNPPSGVLVVDDFSDSNVTRNTMGGQVTWDNQNVSVVAGEGRFSWNGSSSFHDFIETFLLNGCAYDIRMYRSLRFRMRASANNKSVKLYFPRSNSTCGTAATPLGGTVTLTTTMTTYEIDITALTRDKALFLEWSPNSQDSTDYTIDDIHLVP